MITPQDASAKALEICQLAPIVPVLVVEDASIAQDLARALVSAVAWVFGQFVDAQLALAAFAWVRFAVPLG